MTVCRNVRRLTQLLLEHLREFGDERRLVRALQLVQLIETLDFNVMERVLQKLHVLLLQSRERI